MRTSIFSRSITRHDSVESGGLRPSSLAAAVQCVPRRADAVEAAHGATPAVMPITLQATGLFLVVLGFGCAVPVMLWNTFLSVRFTTLYVRRSGEKMPFLPFDFGGRWQRVFMTPHADPAVERMRRHFVFSQRLIFAPFVLALLGVGVIAVSSRIP